MGEGGGGFGKGGRKEKRAKTRRSDGTVGPGRDGRKRPQKKRGREGSKYFTYPVIRTGEGKGSQPLERAGTKGQYPRQQAHGATEMLRLWLDAGAGGTVTRVMT